MGQQSTKQMDVSHVSGNKAFSDNNLVHGERKMRSALSWKLVRFRNRLRMKRPCSEAAASMKETDCKTTKPKVSFLKCDSRQVKSMHRLGLNSASMTFEDLGTSKPFADNKSKAPKYRPTSLNVDVQLRRTDEKLNALESTDTLEVGHTRPESDHWPITTGDKLFAVNESTPQNILDQTVTFLAYEIDPFVIEEFLQSRRACRKGVEVGSDFFASDFNSIERTRSFLLVLLRDPLSEEYRLFCDLLRDQGTEHYVADFLETLSTLIRLQDAPTNKIDTALSNYLFKSTTASDQKDTECCCIYQEDFSRKDHRFDVSMVYVDRESRTAKSFKGVASMKRRKQRKSRTELDDLKVCLGDTSDRYIPMMSVHLYKQCLCDPRMRSLQRLVATYPCIRDLSIVKTRLEDQAKIRLGRALELNVGLYQLDLSLSAMGNDGAMYLADALRANRSLRVLNLSSNELTARGCDFLVKALLRNRTLNDLDLGFNEIGDQGGISLAGALQTSKCTLQRLRLRNNGISSRGATALFSALRRNSRLCLLDMSSNDICDDCLCTLSDVLIYNRTLTDLVVDNCRVSKIGCSSLARPLKINTVLRRLSLNMNPFGDSGLNTLVDGIKYNRSVTEISLNMCGITNCGLWHLLDASRYNTTMKMIKLCYNLIDLGPQPKYGVRALREGGERRSSAIIGQNSVTSDISLKAERRSSLFVERRRITSMGESRSVTFVGHDDISSDIITRSELYAKLVEALHNNSPLKIVLWGNRLDDFNPTISETLITDAFNYN